MFWGTIARDWFTGPHGNVGLAGIEVCRPFCVLKLWNDLHAPADLVMLGFTGFLGGLNAAGFAAHGFAMIVKGRPERVKARTIAVLAVVTAASCVGFLLRARSEDLALSYPGFLAIGGSVALVIVLYAMVKPLNK
jgi:hypothetical protein